MSAKTRAPKDIYTILTVGYNWIGAILKSSAVQSVVKMEILIEPECFSVNEEPETNKKRFPLTQVVVSS
jgi:hypothetical protein